MGGTCAAISQCADRPTSEFHLFPRPAVRRVWLACGCCDRLGSRDLSRAGFIIFPADDCSETAIDGAWRERKIPAGVGCTAIRRIDRPHYRHRYYLSPIEIGRE